MLLNLRIQDYVLIDETELRLGPGYNVVTGETGAGKSILIGALGLVLGGRARADVVRNGCKEAIIEALFDIEGSTCLAARLDEAGIPHDGELLIRRVVQHNGRSRAYLNGRMCTVGELSELALTLADVTSQHESVALSDPGSHIDYLDRYAGLDDERQELSSVVQDLETTLGAIRALNHAERTRGEREGFLRYQLEQIDTLDPQPDEINKLDQERKRLEHATRLVELTAGTVQHIDGSASWSGADDNSDAGPLGREPIADRLGRLCSDLVSAAELDSSLSPLAEQLEDCWSQLRDVSAELSDYAVRLNTDPEALAEIRERLFALQDLARKHGPTIDDVLVARERIEEELAGFESSQEHRTELESKRQALTEVAATKARRLSRKRRKAARALGQAITAELKSLGMGSARVLVEVSPCPPRNNASEEDPIVTVDSGKLGRSGIDRVELLIAPNKGLDPKPLSRIASGGELSRALLAVKKVLGGYEGAGRAIGVQVFDEVDTGVGGATADKIGRCISSISQHRQVLCITHLASIAAGAETHFVVRKDDSDSMTKSQIDKLDERERVGEIARMLTGEHESKASRKAAKELLKHAQSATTAVAAQ